MRLVLSALSLLCIICLSEQSQGLESLLNEAKRLISAGDSVKALSNLNEVLRLDSSSYLAYYYRGMINLSSGKIASALSDYEDTLRLNQDFEPVFPNLAKLYVKCCQYSKAIEVAKAFQSKHSGNAEFAQIIEEAKSLEHVLKSGEGLSSGGNYEKCIESMGIVIEKSPYCLKALEIRAQSLLKMERFDKASFDFEKLAALQNDSRDTHLLLARIYYGRGDEERGLAHLQKCLHSDQEYKPCKTIYSKMKLLKNSFKSLNEKTSSSILKEKASFLETARKSDAIFTEKSYKLADLFTFFDNELIKFYCCAYLKERKGKEAVDYCKKASVIFEENESFIVKLAEAYQLEKDFETAVKILEEAIKKNEHSEVLHGALKSAKQKLAKSQQVDYYEVLGVDKQASKAEIKKQYKRMAAKYHPDKNPDNAEESSKKMVQLNHAYEILMDDEKRRMFDAGIDPNDPHGGAGGNPFGGDFFDMFRQQQQNQHFRQSQGGGGGQWEQFFGGGGRQRKGGNNWGGF